MKIHLKYYPEKRDVSVTSIMRDKDLVAVISPQAQLSPPSLRAERAALGWNGQGVGGRGGSGVEGPTCGGNPRGCRRECVWRGGRGRGRMEREGGEEKVVDLLSSRPRAVAQPAILGMHRVNTLGETVPLVGRHYLCATHCRAV